MHIIKLNATNSTNTFLKQLASTEKLKDYTIVSAKHQLQGKGQRGTHWQSESSKNLTFSVFKQLNWLKPEEHFYLSIIVAIAVLKTLKSFGIPKLNIKWPNDILSENKKLCGILIENNTTKTKINASIIGVGINVNQICFKQLPKATSMKLVSGNTYILDEVLSVFITKLKYYFRLLEEQKHEQLNQKYLRYLFRKNKPSTFKCSASGNLFTGVIKGIDATGNLIIWLEDDIEKSFSLKELSMLY